MVSGKEPAEGPYPPPGVLVTGHFREGFGYGVRRSGGSGNWLLTYTLDGGGLYRQPGVELRTGSGDLVLLAPGAVHDYSVPEGGSWEFLWVHFRPRAGWAEWMRFEEVGTGLYLARLREVRARVEVAFRGLHADALAGGVLAEELALNGLEEVLLVAAREGAGSRERAMDRRVLRVLAAVSENPAAPHDLATLAREVSLSPSRLSHLFKEQTGDTVMNTVNALRLRRAARLLEHTAESVGSISRRTGFDSPYYFSRRFRRHFGVSPRLYREARRPGK